MDDLASQIIILSSVAGIAVGVVMRQFASESKLEKKLKTYIDEGDAKAKNKYQTLLDKFEKLPYQIEEIVKRNDLYDDLKAKDITNKLEDLKQDMLRFVKGLNSLQGNIFEGKDSIQNQITRLEGRIDAIKEQLERG